MTEPEDVWAVAPEGWCRVRLRSLIQSAENGSWGQDVAEGQTAALCIRAADFDRTKLRIMPERGVERGFVNGELHRFQLEAGDILLEKSGGGERQPVGKAVLVENVVGPTVASNFLARLKPSKIVDPAFLVFLMEALYATGVNTRHIKQSTGIQNLDAFSYFNERVVLPPMDEQRAIVRFLDERTAKIDALIGKSRQVLDRVDAMRRARLASVFDAYEVQTWQALRRYVRSIEQGISPLCDDRRRDGAEWAVLKLSAVSRGKFLPYEHKVLPDGLVTSSRYEVQDGDLLITRSNTPDLVGDSCIVVDPPPRLILCDLIYRVRLSDEVSPTWVDAFLRSPQGRSALEATARGSSRSMVKLRATDIKDVRLPIPSRDEQVKRIEELMTNDVGLAAIRSRVVNHIGLLQEYRSALITAAVTGQIDVGSAA